MQNLPIKSPQLSLGEKLRALRVAANWTQPELANKLNIEQSHLSRLENGHHYPSEELLLQIVATFEISAAQLFEGVDKSSLQQHFRHAPKIVKLLEVNDEMLMRRSLHWMLACLGLSFVGAILATLGFIKFVNEAAYFYVESLNPPTHKSPYIYRDSFFSFEFLGDSVNHPLDGEPVNFKFSQDGTHNVTRWPNQFLKFIGIWLISMGGIGLVLQKRILLN